MTTIPRQLVNNYDRTLSTLRHEGEYRTQAILDRYFAQNPDATVADARAFSEELMMGAVDMYGSASSEAAKEMITSVSQLSRRKPPSMRSIVFTPDGEQIATVAHYQAGKLVDGNREGFISQITRYVGEAAELAANWTMLTAGKKSDLLFASVPTGGSPCTLCLAIAANGFQHFKNGKTGRTEVHEHCTCRLIPGYKGANVEGHDPDEYYQRWKEQDRAEKLAKMERDAAK